MTKGYVSMVLHSHMPFIRHPEYEDSLEERWLYEAMSECYIPLIDVYDNLLKDNIKFKITMSITPPLMEMLQDEHLNKNYLRYLKKSIELSEKELLRTKNDILLNKTVEFYNERFNKLLSIYKDYDYRLMDAFKKFNELGNLEIITCSATHGLLPLLMVNPETVKAQIAVGVESYIKCIGHAPKGIWLPECAYTYSLDSILEEYGIKYFISESKAVLHASPKPIYGTYAPIATSNGVSTFARDLQCSHQVWSNFDGYPGDSNYREFYKDIGYESPIDYIAPYIHRDGIRIDTGLKYYKITGKTNNKEYYNRAEALKKAKVHGEHFAHSRNEQIEQVSSLMDKPPIITCPYDTELFGHWWFEGPDFISSFMRKSSEKGNNFELITPSEYLEKYPLTQCCSPCPSSWGENSDYSVWINSSNDWIYKDLHSCAKAMIRLANSYENPTEIEERALNQAARELMLAESSDWPFIIKNKTSVTYAVQRINRHIDRFNKLYEQIIKNAIDIKLLEEIESLDNIFQDINYRVYKKDAI